MNIVTVSEKVSDFVRYGQHQRGWSANTIRSHQFSANKFCEWLQTRNIEFDQVCITDVDAYLSGYQLRGNCSRWTVRSYATRLRAFFRYAEHQGWCSPGISEGIVAPRVYPDQPVPKGISRESAVKLLATTEGGKLTDLRARAIMLLLITYGLRAGEICALQLPDIDWHEGMIRLRRPKPGQTHYYPLSAGVGNAIVNYLQKARPSHQNPTLFVTLNAPYRALSSEGVYSIIAHRMKKIGVTGQKRGPHALRHAAAQHLLDQGLSMKTVGDYLGHRSIAATAAYAKVDLNSLREVASFDMEEWR